MTSSSSIFESKASSLEQKESFAPADLESIFAQVDKLLKDKYIGHKITLKGSFTPEQLSQLTEKLQQVESQWRDSMSFSDYKASRKSDDEISDHQLSNKFDEIKSGSVDWYFIVESVEDTPALVSFIAAQLRAKKISRLDLKQRLSEKSMEGIIYACKNSSLIALDFSCREQVISDEQAIVLLECMNSSRLAFIFNLPGKNISNKTADGFVVIVIKREKYVGIVECPYFDERRTIEHSIRDAHGERYFGLFSVNYQENDIVRLTAKLTNASNYQLNFCLQKGDYSNANWVQFFTQVLTSKTNVIKLYISHSIEISDEVMIAIVTSLSINNTIKELHIAKPMSEDVISALAVSFKLNTSLASVELSNMHDAKKVTSLVTALENHPTLTSLMLNGSSCRGTGNVFKNLLIQNKKLEKIFLVGTCSNDDTISGLASGLERNVTLKNLYLGGNYYTSDGLARLGEALVKNQYLTHLYLSVVDKHTVAGLRDFAESFQLNKSVVELFSPYYVKDESEIGPVEQLLDPILERNKRLAHFRQLEYELENRQPYVETAIILFQANRQNLSCFKVSVFLENILSFLAPLSQVASLEQTKRCTDLVRNNIFTKKWQAAIEYDVGAQWGYGYKDMRTFTVFKKWSGCTDTFKVSRDRVAQGLADTKGEEKKSDKGASARM